MNTREQLAAKAQLVPFWWHSIDLGHGVITDGLKTSAQLENELRDIRLPDLKGKTVLDIGAYDGFFSFEAERRGASRVVALDHFVWELEIDKCLEYWRECKKRGIDPDPNAQVNRMHPNELPGMLAYKTAHEALHSKVETVVADFMATDLSQLGTFDVVLFLGVLYHLQNPVEALKRLASVTRELAIIETEAMVVPNQEDHALCEFFEGCELNSDWSNWWAPNEKAVVGMCRAAGFRRVEVLHGAPSQSQVGVAGKSFYLKARHSIGHVLREFQLRPPLEIKPTEIIRYRAIVHAWN